MPKYKEDIRAPSDDERLGVVTDVEIDKIDPFPNHPYKVQDDEAMEQLATSIQSRGLITPILVRKQYHGRYELISGHRRLYACKKLGMNKIKCEVVEMTKEEATIAMVESNLQRDRILPSEKAFAYKMRLDAMKMLISRIKDNKNKGGETLSGVPFEEQLEKANASIMRTYGLSEKEVKSIGTAASRRKSKSADPVGPRIRSNELLARSINESTTQIKRYIRLTELIPELLDLVDEGKLGMRTAVELSYLEHRQQDVWQCIDIEQCVPTHAQSIRMRRLFQEGKLTPRDIQAIMVEEKPNQKERIVLHGERFKKLIPKGVHKQEYEDYIAAAMEHYAKYLERKRKDYER